MSKPLELQVNDTYFNKALNKLKALEDDFAKEVDDELEAAAIEIVRKAKENVTTVDNGLMRAAIVSNKLSLLRQEIRVGVNYAAYIEFGTGEKYQGYASNLTNEWKNIAREYFKNGKGMTRPAPYLYPAVKVVLKDFKKRFKDRLKALLKK